MGLRDLTNSTRRSVIKSVGGAGLGLGVLSGAVSAGSDEHPLNKILDTKDQYDIPCLQLAVTEDEGSSIALKRSYGYSEGNNEYLGDYHRFRIASLSKPITSAAIMHLEETGEISLDDEVFGSDGILPYDEPTDIRHPYRDPNIEVRHLLTHTSGFNFGGTDPVYEDSSSTAEEIVERVVDEYSVSQVGGYYEYQNFNYVTLGLILEEVTYSNYESYVQDVVLEPAGAGGMQVGRDEQYLRGPDEVYYYGNNPYWDNLKFDQTAAQGGWIGSALEVLAFANSVVHGDLLDQSTTDRIFEENVPNPGYGLGWHIWDSWYGHNGSINGAESLVRCNPDSGYSFALLYNKRNDRIDDEDEILSENFEDYMHELVEEIK